MGKDKFLMAIDKIYEPSLIELIDQNYQAVRNRGLITDDTDFYDFMEKLEEETQELSAEWLKCEGLNLPDDFNAELIDCISVLLNMAKHYNIDVIEGLKQNIIKNQKRAENGKSGEVSK